MSTTLPVAEGRELGSALWQLLGRHRGAFVYVVTMQSAAAVVGLVGPWLLGDMVDAVKDATATFTYVNWMILVFTCAVLAQTVLVRFAQRASMVLGEKVFARLREDFIGTVTALPLSTVEKAGTGDLLSRTTRDLDRVQFTVRFGIPRILVVVATIVITVVAVLARNWLLGLALVVGLPLLLAAVRYYLKRATKAYLAEAEAWAELNGSFTESVEGARTVEALALAAKRRRRSDHDIAAVAQREGATLRLRNRLFPAVDIAFGLPSVAVLVWGAFLVSTGHANVGDVTTIATFTVSLMGPVWELIFWVDDFQVSAVSLARILGVAQVPPDRTASGATPSDEHIVATDVEYAYREGVPVLHGIDLDLAVGERLAIVGPSGAGKSTFGRMLSGIHPPTSGSVKVGGVPLVDLPLEDLRSHVALVTQEHHVFVGSVSENLVLARPEASEDEVWEALRAVDAEAWVRALPEGLATQVGSGNHELTPAQAQQVALARLVLLDPHTLVLDEATSLIDPRQARDLEASLAGILEGRTVVAIAHRLYTAHDADRVAVIDGGVITEIGSHQELVDAGGDYARLWHSWQSEEPEAGTA